MRNHRVSVWILAAVLTLAAAPVRTEDEPQSEIKPVGGLTFVDELELTIANLVVYVTDKQGRAVTDLTADDFEVSQDGDKKQITNFKLYTDEIIRTELQQATSTAPLATPTPKTWNRSTATACCRRPGNSCAPVSTRRRR